MDWCWSWSSNTWATWYLELTHWKRPWFWERLKVRREGDDRGWDGWMASPTQWTWVWVSSGSWWWTGRPGVVQSMMLQRVGHDWATKLNWNRNNMVADFVSIQELNNECYFLSLWSSVCYHCTEITFRLSGETQPLWMSSEERKLKGTWDRHKRLWWKRIGKLLQGKRVGKEGWRNFSE